MEKPKNITFRFIRDGLLTCVKCWILILQAIYRLFIPVSEKSVRGEIVLITGAGSGIGRELALQYALQCATVVCWDINEKGNSETVRAINSLDLQKAYAYCCDVTNRQQVYEIANRVQNDVGNVSILINNAGIMYSRPFLKQSSQNIEQVINVNTMAHFWTLKAFLPMMLERNHGHIVAVCSLLGIVGLRNLVPYCASKFAVRGMMEALFKELQADRKCKVKTTTIFPSAANTGLFDAQKAKSRFPILLNILDAREVAEYIMKAQRRDMVETSVPRHFLNVNYSLRLLPATALMYLLDFLKLYIEPDH